MAEFFHCPWDCKLKRCPICESEQKEAAAKAQTDSQNNQVEADFEPADAVEAVSDSETPVSSKAFASPSINESRTTVKKWLFAGLDSLFHIGRILRFCVMRQ